MRPTGVALPFVAIFVVLSGCTSGFEGPRDFTVPRDAPDTAAQEGVPEPYSLTIEVRANWTQGEPLSGAGVVFFVTQTEEVSSGVFWRDLRTTYQPLAGARSNSAGEATGRLAPNQAINVAVGDVAGYTTEVRMRVVLGGPGESGRIVVPLFRTELPINVSATLDSNFAVPEPLPGATPVWQSVPVPFHEQPEAQAGYLARLTEVAATLAWQNTPTQYGDLYAGVAVGDERPALTGPDALQLPTDAMNEETIEADASELSDLREAYLSEGALSLAALTDSAALSLNGLPFQFGGAATFFASDFTIHG